MRKRGFTLMELLIVIGIIAILAAIVIIAINPGRQLAKSRDSQRWSNVNTLLNGIHQQAIDNNGTVNAAISVECSAGTQSIDNGGGGGGADLSSLVPDYTADLVSDPTAATGVNTGYTVCKTGNRITVSAPAAEIDTPINATR